MSEGSTSDAATSTVAIVVAVGVGIGVVAAARPAYRAARVPVLDAVAAV